MSLPLDELAEILDGAGIRLTFSLHCRSGLIGDLCRCWRCRGDDGPSEDEGLAERDAEIADCVWNLRLRSNT